jgi:hypothetical protein
LALGFSVPQFLGGAGDLGKALSALPAVGGTLCVPVALGSQRVKHTQGPFCGLGRRIDA